MATKRLKDLTNEQTTFPPSAALLWLETDPTGTPVDRKMAVSVLLSCMPQGMMLNGKIVPSVASNNLTVALKTLAGTDPSATDPVYVRIGANVRIVTAALSVTVNAGANSFNAGGAELATNEIDYFVYLGYNATDGVVIGFSRIPFANQYSDFSATATNEKYAKISTITNAAATDYYENIGRFAATLSAGAGYTWTVPTFTASNLINRPIYSTRILQYTPVITYSGGTTDPTSNTPVVKNYVLDNHNFKLSLQSTLVVGGGNRTATIFSIPFTFTTIATNGIDSVSSGGALKAPLTVISGAAIYFYETIASNGSYYATVNAIY